MADEGITSKLGEAHVEVRAPTTHLQKDLQAAKQVTEAATGSMKKGFKDVDEQVTHATRALLGLRGTIGTIIAIPLLQQAVGLFRTMADQIEDIGIKAKTVGLTAEEFQKLTYAARQADLTTEELSTSLAFFAKGLGQAQAGVGPLVDTLKRIDPELAKQIKTAKSMREAIDIAADAMGSLASAEEQGAVSTTLFGRAGQGMLRVFGQGAKGLREAGDEASRLGQVLSDAQIDEGGKLSDAFTEAAAAIRNEFMKALVDLAPYIVKTIELVTGLVKIVSAIPYAIKGLNGLRIDSGIEDVSKQIQTLEGQLIDLQNTAQNGNAVSSFFAAGSIEKAAQELDILKNQFSTLQRQKAELQKPFTTEEVGGKPAEPEGRRLKPSVSDEDLKKLADERKKAQDDLKAFHVQYLQDTEQFTESVIAEQAKELEKFQEMLDKKLISEEQFHQVRAELAEVTSKKLREAWDKEFKDLLAAGQVVAGGLESAFATFVETGKFDVKEMVRSMLVDLAKLQFQKGVIQPLFGGGSTAGGGLLGSLFGSGFKFHSGGKVGSGGTPISVNPMLWAGAPRLHDGLMPDEYRAILQKGETVIPKGMSPGGGTTVQVINNTGAPVKEERSRQGDTEITRIIVGTVNEAMGSGRFDTTMRGRYGSRQQTRKT
jgi:Lambda phage tail tape-measure protein (Tape_meas_lam_C)